MENTKILIYQRDEVIKQIDQTYEAEKALLLTKANNVIALFTEFDDTYSESGSTTAKYNELLVAGPQSYINAAVNKIKAEFATAGITSHLVVNAATAQIDEKGNAFLKAFNELLQYLDLKSAYPELKFALTDIKVVNGLAAVKSEKDLEKLKDIKARQFIDTEIGHDLMAKAESLAVILNSINTTLRDNGLYNFTDLNEFSELADYVFPNKGSNAQLEVNLKGVYDLATKIKNKLTG